VIPGETWHADETYIKISGKGFWLWVVRCKESGNVLAWHISKNHLLKDAKLVIQKALDNSEGVKPEKIITDGLWQYPVAIYKVMRWSWKEQKIRHVIDSGIGKNYFIERLNREIKRRTGWFKTFQALTGAKAFFALWFYHFNGSGPAT
jgi:transposase-like protein